MEKINIAKLLKDCPQGMELDCILLDNVTFERVEDDGIWIKHVDYKKSCEHDLYLYNDGSFPIHNLGSSLTKCIIFPKGKTTWEGFVPPCKFKDGDVVTNIEGAIIIYQKITTYGYCGSFASLDHCDKFIPHYKSYLTDTIRLATEEEKQKLFQAIKDNGYKWNPETKTLVKVKPKFKIGDKIKHKYEKFRDERTITSCGKSGYWTSTSINDRIDYENQDDWELVSNKFDTNTLVPFESKVLVRDGQSKWKPAIWGFYNEDSSDYHYIVIGGQIYCYCIPYEGNEHLLGTYNDCDDFYKTWEE